ncbi:MAG: hypothetical protein RLY57_261, partial [Candidatus Parcubacteria bacterium]
MPAHKKSKSHIGHKKKTSIRKKVEFGKLTLELIEDAANQIITEDGGNWMSCEENRSNFHLYITTNNSLGVLLLFASMLHLPEEFSECCRYIRRKNLSRRKALFYNEYIKKIARRVLRLVSKI